MYRIGIDVGGTFTDLVAIDATGATTLAKVPSTPQDPSLGVLDGLELLAERLRLNRSALLAQTERIVHGTTVATNALLERKGARLGLLTTEGHRDVIEMREGLKDDRYNLRMPPPEQLVPRRLRLGVRERMRADGRIEIPLDPASLDAAIAVLQQEKIEAVAVCYLHAWRDPRHEHATAEALKRALPDTYLSLSSEVLPQIKEFERVSTTIVNAYVGPVLSRYLARLETRLAEAGYNGPTLIIQSHGGVAPIAEAGRLAAGAVLSGPAGGVAGSIYAARLIGAENLIPFDMGGTSTDISLVVDGAATLVMNRKIGGHRIALNSLDIASIGAGGGSIARVDGGGILHVGPESAGAVPGPACYGQGGRQATVTDANLVLGYLDPDNFLGGDRRLDVAAAERAVDARCLRARPRQGRGGGAAFTASSTRTWPRACGSSLCGAASIPGGSRCSRSAARPGCTPPTSRASSAFRGSSCRASRRCCRPGGCSRPICGSRCRAPISATPARSTAPPSSTCSTRWRPRACAVCAPPVGPGRSTARASARRICAMASRYSRSPCRSTIVRRGGLVRRRPAAADRRALSPPS